MRNFPKVLHLVDDTTAGGVMRVVEFIQTDRDLNETAHHEVSCVERGKLIVDLPPVDVIVSHLAVSWRGLPALIALRASNPRARIIHVEHSYTEGFVAHNVKRPRRFRRLLKTAFALFDRVVCVSNAQADWMIHSGLTHADKLVTIQSCVDLEAFRQLPAPSGPVRVFGAIGRLEPQKGFEMLIQAFRKSNNPDIRLHVIGEGGQEEVLRWFAQGDPRITFKGFKSNPADTLEGIDAVVMPSHWEAYGLVAVEALAAGRRLICNRVDGLQDHAAHGATLVCTSDIGDLMTEIEAQANSSMDDHQSTLRRGNQQERQFRIYWQKLLAEVCPPEMAVETVRTNRSGTVNFGHELQP